MRTPAQQRAAILAPRHHPETVTEVCAAWAWLRRAVQTPNVPPRLARALDALLEEHKQA